ncbi:hypothetical protein AAGS61_20480 [Lysinibacillus sp. KU-BSD001]|uniref:hypothetical protein n=1 Tax=Lysinibacillus sp. KU-BSD001 TaxID=3141328 RepID=UPI0036E17E75
MTRKKILTLASLILVVIVAGILTLTTTASKKEQEAIDTLNEMYNEDFTVAQSTAAKNPFSNDLKVTVQSLNTRAIYDFEVKDGEIFGEYYAENVNIELNKLIEQRINGLAMTNAHLTGVTEAISYANAPIEKLDIKLITNEAVTEEKAQEIASLLQTDLGDVAIQLDALVVEDENDFNGVTEEIQTYFQLSTITLDSFENLDYELQTFSF